MSYNPAADQSGAQLISLLRFIPENQHAGLIAGTSTYDCTAAFAAAKAYILALPYGPGQRGGGVLSIPPGRYSASEIDWTSTLGNFDNNLGIRGSGKNATRITSRAYGQVILNIAGRSDASFQDFTIDSTEFGAQVGILLARTATSPQCNGNTFTNVDVQGFYWKGGVVSIAAEDIIWINSFFRASLVCFWTGTDPANINVTMTSPGTLVASSNTGNAMFGCYFYAPYASATPIVLSTQADYLFSGCTLICNNDNIKMVTYTDLNTGVWSGAVTWEGCHFEGYGTNNVVHYLNCNAFAGVTYFNSIHSIGGSYGGNDPMLFLDFDRTNILNQPILQGSTWTNFWVPSNALDAFYIYGLYSCDISIRPTNADGTLVVFGLVNGCGNVGATNFVMPPSYAASTPYRVLGTATPAAGTWSRGSVVWNSASTVGQPTGWCCSVSGTKGTLNGGATTGTITSGTNVLTVNSLTGLYVGCKIAIATVGGTFIVRKIVDTTHVYLDANAGSSAAAQAVSFSAATFVALANL